MKLQLKYFTKIKIKEDESISPDTFEFNSAKTGRELTREFE